MVQPVVPEALVEPEVLAVATMVTCHRRHRRRPCRSSVASESVELEVVVHQEALALLVVMSSDHRQHPCS